MNDTEATSIKEDIKEMGDTIKLIFKMLNGNGHMGVVTKLALLWAGFWFVLVVLGTVLTSITGIAFYIIQCGLTFT